MAASLDTPDSKKADIDQHRTVLRCIAGVSHSADVAFALDLLGELGKNISRFRGLRGLRLRSAQELPSQHQILVVYRTIGKIKIEEESVWLGYETASMKSHLLSGSTRFLSHNPLAIA